MDGYALMDVPRSGVENMALDQCLLETAAQRQCVFLRTYRWLQPTLSLGYFQAYADRYTHGSSSSLPVVRRSTGGGAIVHHFDWTYCVVIPDSLQLQESVGEGGRPKFSAARNIGASQTLYDCVHDAVVGWLQAAGIAAFKWGPARQPTEQLAVYTEAWPKEGAGEAVGCQTRVSNSEFLCFKRRSCGDLLVGEHKVMGSAQRRTPGAILQHGSLLLAASPHAPELAGLEGYARLGGEAAFHSALVEAVQIASGVKLHPATQPSECLVEWHWPRPSYFAETKWTERR